MSGSQPERLTIMKDMFNAEAWGRWYEAWSLSDEEEMDASVCLDVFETMRLDEDGFGSKSTVGRAERLKAGHVPAGWILLASRMFAV